MSSHNNSYYEEILTTYVREICKYISKEGATIHINSGTTKLPVLSLPEDIARQAFLFFALSKVVYMMPSMSSLVRPYCMLLLNHIKEVYAQRALLPHEYVYTLTYLIRGLLFLGEEYSLYKDDLFVTYQHLLYRDPLIINLLLSLEKDGREYFGVQLCPSYQVDHLQESLLFIMKSSLEERYRLCDVVPILYHGDYFSLPYKESFKKILIEKEKILMVQESSTYTSAFASLFEGFSSIPSYHDKASLYLKKVQERNVSLNGYLKKHFLYGEFTLEEKKGSSYVCLDTYTHIILGCLNYIQKETTS